MNIVVDGSTLSLLLYAHINGNGNQTGFLLGYKTEEVEDRISDSQIHTEDTKCYIYVTSFVPWPSLKQLYYGQDDGISIKDIHKTHEGVDEEVIGWYSLRHQSSLRPSLKEVSTHHQLTTIEEFEENQDFLFLLCSSSASPNLSTHSSDHAFLSYDLGTRKFKANSMTIRNLGDTSRSEYQKPSMIHSHLAQDFVNKSKGDFVKPTGEMDQVVKMKHLTDSIGKNLSSLQVQVNKSETNVCHLEEEVRSLRKKMAHLETKDMRLTFEREQQRIKEEEEGNLLKESVSEADEEEQVNKLLTDLGLPIDIASNLFQKSEEKTRRLSEDQDNLILWEKLEVNPLYASTLHNAQAPSFDFVPIEDSQSENGENITDDSPPSNLSKEADAKNSATWKGNPKTLQNNHANEAPKDPFDFVETFKSELNVRKPGSLSEASSNKSSPMVSIKSSAVYPSIYKDSQKDKFEPYNSEMNHGNKSIQDSIKVPHSNSTKSNGKVVDSSDVQENSSKLSSSPVF